MSLHDEIIALDPKRQTHTLPFACGYDEAKHDAAKLAIKADAEIARLSVALEAAKNALKEAIQDCREAYDKGRADQAVDDLPREIQIAAMSQDAQRLTGENAVLRGLLQDVLSLIRNIECGCWSPEGTDNLRVRIEGALNGQGRYVPSDGQIYAETSRRADPEAHAVLDKLVDKLRAIVEKSSGES